MKQGLPGDAFGNRIQIFIPDLDKICEPVSLAASALTTFDVHGLSGYSLYVTGEVRRHLLNVDKTPIETAWAESQEFELDDVLLVSGRLYRATAAHTAATANEPGVGGSWGSVWSLIPYVIVPVNEVRGVPAEAYKLVLINAGASAVTACLEGM